MRIARWLFATALVAGCHVDVHHGRTAHDADREAAAQADGTPAPAATSVEVACPPGAAWDGRRCVVRQVVVELSCPAGSRWDGRHCMATAVRCPEGSRWHEGECVAAPPAPADGAIVARAAGGFCLFSIDGVTQDRPADRLVRTVSAGEHVVRCDRRGAPSDELRVTVPPGGTVDIVLGGPRTPPPAPRPAAAPPTAPPRKTGDRYGF
jgi:hypothetical protein